MKPLWAALAAGTVLWAASPQPVQTFRLPSGLQVRLVEDHDRPLVRLEFRVTWKPGEIPPGREGLVSFMARLLEAPGTAEAASSVDT